MAFLRRLPWRLPSVVYSNFDHFRIWISRYRLTQQELSTQGHALHWWHVAWRIIILSSSRCKTLSMIGTLSEEGWYMKWSYENSYIFYRKAVCFPAKFRAFSIIFDRLPWNQNCSTILRRWYHIKKNPSSLHLLENKVGKLQHQRSSYEFFNSI